MCHVTSGIDSILAQQRHIQLVYPIVPEGKQRMYVCMSFYLSHRNPPNEKRAKKLLLADIWLLFLLYSILAFSDAQKKKRNYRDVASRREAIRNVKGELKLKKKEAADWSTMSGSTWLGAS
ncbi:hypothetical protein AVEN_189630-1 [Araneus ventricosus]|uniref:Uncharacterized protein n=1 Tax=Araneus ventricosus TaxID=182803 RepID=A0A4Y2P461_ARAVE|nr:hypothetical protein AVEN_189630-1 [Araneus ventricosus]